MSETHSAEKDVPVRLTDAENAWIMRVWGALPGRDRLAAEKRELERIISARLAGCVRPESITTHNATPVTPENLRYAATHEALSRSWIFDVLTGLADALDTRPIPPGGPDA